jgi:hypothetical protein
MNRALAFLLFALQPLAAPLLQAHDLAGTVSRVLGASSVERAAPTAALSEGSYVFEGDTLRTGPDALLQLAMVDNASLLLLPDSVLIIQDYARPERTRDTTARETGDGKVTLRLLKGGFRARSGSIGRSGNRGSYQIIAPVATLGVQGAEFSLRFCAKDCRDEPDVAVRNGLYLSVHAGAVWIQNAGGETVVKSDSIAFIDSASSAAELLKRDAEGAQAVFATADWLTTP